MVGIYDPDWLLTTRAGSAMRPMGGLGPHSRTSPTLRPDITAMVDWA